MGSLEEIKKWDDISIGQWKALGIKCGGIEAVKLVLRDEMEIVVRKAVKLVFDNHGRCIPRNLRAKVRDADPNLYFNQPEMAGEIDYAKYLLRLHEMLGIDTGITAKQFWQETERQLAIIRNNPLVANILKGIWLPIILTRRRTKDPGQEMDWHLEALTKSYRDVFPDRKFCNRQNRLATKVFLEKSSQYDQAWERKDKKHSVALFFPNPLQGLSINAQRETIDRLNEFGFVLSGAIEPMIMYPDILFQSANVPNLDLSAFSCWPTHFSFCFEAYNENVTFFITENLINGCSHHSGSLLFLPPE